MTRLTNFIMTVLFLHDVMYMYFTTVLMNVEIKTNRHVNYFNEVCTIAMYFLQENMSWRT